VARAQIPPTGAVVITDPAGVKALAHPARLAVIDALYAGEILTATQCAQIAGITPSAMSYHLRALEKHGIVVRAEAGADGRERPWMRAGDVLSSSIGRTRSPGAQAAAGLLVDQALGLDAERLHRAMGADAQDSDGVWSRTTTYNRDLLVLTPDEARELSAELTAVAGRYLADRRRGKKRPDGAATFAFAFLLARDPDA
jgi:DNA-binding transcriptional ArsR family regulator